jgi:hypothetical protein
LGRFLDIRTDSDEMPCPGLGDDQAFEHSILQGSDAGPHVHTALDDGDAVADPRHGDSRRRRAHLQQNGEIDPAALTGFLPDQIEEVFTGGSVTQNATRSGSSPESSLAIWP